MNGHINFGVVLSPSRCSKLDFSSMEHKRIKTHIDHICWIHGVINTDVFKFLCTSQKGGHKQGYSMSSRLTGDLKDVKIFPALGCSEDLKHGQGKWIRECCCRRGGEWALIVLRISSGTSESAFPTCRSYGCLDAVWPTWKESLVFLPWRYKKSLEHWSI